MHDLTLGFLDFIDRATWSMRYERCSCGQEWVKRFKQDRVVRYNISHGAGACWLSVHHLNRRY
jgi:hypothetical protein